MTSQSTLLLLRERLLQDADPHLLEFVSTPTRCHDILVMSLGQFCAEAGVDERQATAFFKAFGANSFLTFKRILRDCLYSEPTELGTVSRSTASIASEIIRDELLNLTELWQNLDCAGLQRLAEDIATASEIFIIGQGTSSTYARELSRMLGTLGINSRFSSLKDPEQFAELELALGRDPLMITFAFPRYSKPLLMRIRALKQRGLRLVSITDRSRSPYASLADYYFTLPVRSFDFADSHCAGMAWINILSITIALRNKEKVFSKMQEREMHIDEMNMFL